MTDSNQLLEAGADIWDVQQAHPFVRELADGTLDETAIQCWVRQYYRYLFEYARVFAIAGTKANAEEEMTGFLDVARTVLDDERDLHRAFADGYGRTPTDLHATKRSPACLAYTNLLVRTAHEGSLAEIAAAIYPCCRGYLDIGEHIAERATEEHRYTPFVGKYTSAEFRDSVAWMRDVVDRYAESYPGEHDAMREAFLTSARLEYRFWEKDYTQGGWGSSQ